MSQLSRLIYHVCIRLCGRLPLPTGETCFVLKNFIHELCMACVGFCQQAAERTSKRVDEGALWLRLQLCVCWDATNGTEQLNKKASLGECKHFSGRRHSRKGEGGSWNQNIRCRNSSWFPVIVLPSPSCCSGWHHHWFMILAWWRTIKLKYAQDSCA